MVTSELELVLARLGRLVEELSDTRRAIEDSRAGRWIAFCGCGSPTVEPPCPKCKREKQK